MEYNVNVRTILYCIILTFYVIFINQCSVLTKCYILKSSRWQILYKNIFSTEHCSLLKLQAPIFTKTESFHKYFLSFIITAANYLFLWSNSQRNFSVFQRGCNHFQALTDEQVYAGLYHTIWKEPIRYQNVILLMGGFHQVIVRQKIICKQHNIIGSRKWSIDVVVGVEITTGI